MRRRTAVIAAVIVVAAPVLGRTAIGEPLDLRDMLLRPASPYLARAGGAGWDFGGQPILSDNGHGYTITAPDLSYRYGDTVARFGSTAVSLQPQGDAWKVRATPSRIEVHDAAGVALAATAAKAVVEGLWLPERHSFDDLTINLHQVDGHLRGGHSVALQQVAGRFKTKPAAVSAERTGAFGGDLSVKGIRGAAADGSVTRLDHASLRLDLTNMQQSPLLNLSYGHERPAAAGGLAREFVPTRLTFDGRVAPFPWREMLPRLPELLGRMALTGGSGDVSEALAPLGDVLGRAGSRAEVTRAAAASPSLTANGSGDVRFRPDGQGVGELVVEVKGLDDRLRSLSPSEQKRSPEVLPALTLMSMLGQPEGRGGDRVQRYHLELKPDGAIALNGRNSAALNVLR